MASTPSACSTAAKALAAALVSASAALARALDALPGVHRRLARQQRAGVLVEAAYVLERFAARLLELFEADFLLQRANQALTSQLAAAGAVVTGAGARAFALIATEQESTAARVENLWAVAASCHAQAFHSLLNFLQYLAPLKRELAALRASTFTPDVVLSCLRQLLLQPRLGVAGGCSLWLAGWLYWDGGAPRGGT